MKKIKNHFFLLLALALFLGLTLKFINILPYMDGNIDFVQTLDFNEGGLGQYFSNWNTVHPPLKLILTKPIYQIFGTSPASYSILGIIFGVIGITSIYFLTRDLFGKYAGNLAVMFFSIYPLFIANSIFSMRDAILTSLILCSILFYRRNQFILYAIVSSLAVMTKETALLLPIIIIFIEIIFFIKNRKLNTKNILNYLLLLIPTVVYYLWKLVLNLFGKDSWGEWIFTDTGDKGAIFTIINNLITLQFINPYSEWHWKQVIFLNFNWLYILIIFLAIMIYIFKFKKIKFHKNSDNFKTLLVVILFITSYFLTVLSLQTYTIPRYALPVIPFLLIGLSKSITALKNDIVIKTTGVLIFILISISLFYSVDPVAKRIWGNFNIFNNSIYATNDRLAGNDGITYNVQYLLIAEERSGLIKNAEGDGIASGYCRWIFPDPNNEIKMLRELKHNHSLYCIQIR